MSGSNQDIFSQIQVIKKLSKGKFQVFLTKFEEKMYALKVFPYQDNKMSRYFKNEARFVNIDNENIITIASLHHDTTTLYNGKPQSSSVILMEYAPFGTLSDGILNNRTLFQDEKLIRTYFRQFLNGLEYLHANGVYHLDIKPENILIGEDYQLKICDFDLSYVEKQDKKICSRGTRYYRAPELMNESCTNASAADIYSTGILLWVLKTTGSLPHIEDQEHNGVNYFRLLQKTNKSDFWSSQSMYLKKKPSFFSQEFKELVEAMLEFDCQMRPNLSEIKRSKWYNGEVYSATELKELMSKNFKC